MKGIECCAECVYYRMKTHKCSRGAKVDPDIQSGDDVRYFADCPLADVRPMKHGKWVDTNTELMPMHRYDEFTDPEAVFWATCSSCNITVNHQGVAGGWSYCPHCGAEMRGGDYESNS